MITYIIFLSFCSKGEGDSTSNQTLKSNTKPDFHENVDEEHKETGTESVSTGPDETQNRTAPSTISDHPSQFLTQLQFSDCNYTTQSLCGDVCIDQNSNCYCGNLPINSLGESMACHVPASERIQCQENECSNGTVFPLTALNNGKCYNDYKDGYNKSLGPQAMFKCANSEECVRVSAMCRGYALCSDGSDIQECNKNLRCVTNIWSNYTLHSLESGHHYCQYHETDDDGKFDVIGRKDETSFNIANFNISMIFDNQTGSKVCDVLANYTTALTCGSKCIQNYEWCRAD